MNTRPLALTLLLLFSLPALAPAWQCPPTRPDAQGPYYRENAPLRNSVGEGYLLIGEVKAAADCSPIPAATIELWLAGPGGHYDDRWRATVIADDAGRYWFRTPYPGRYGGRPPHIHIIVNAPGYRELVTQHYPAPYAGEGLFDLVLLPAR